MDEVITCPKCKGQTWVLGTSGTRCGACSFWLHRNNLEYASARDWIENYERAAEKGKPNGQD